MKPNIARTVILCVAFMALVMGLTANRILRPAVMSQEQMSELGLFVYDVPRRLSDFTLVDQDGQPFTKERLRGHWNLLFFGYTFCPDICPVTMATIRQFDDLLAQDIPAAAENLQVVMVSVDPQRDTPEKLGQYVRYFGADYLGVTGEYIDIFNLARQVNVAFGYQPQGEEGEYLVNHSGEIILINPEGHFHGFFKVPHDPERMLSTFESVLTAWSR